MPDYDYLSGRRSDIRIHALTNRIYYQERQRIFEWREGVVKAIAILAGSIAFAKVADADILQYCSAAITVSSAAALVFGFGNKARDSAKRSVEWALVERDMARAGERHFTEDQINQWAARCTEIEIGEPAAHAGLLEQSYQRACIALGSKPTASTLWQRWRPALVIH